MVDGEMYVFPVVLRDEWANGFGPVIRTDLLEENGIATPTTWDEVLDALAQLSILTALHGQSERELRTC